jgi:hypothetical protein
VYRELSFVNDSILGFSACGSDRTGDVFHERKDISIQSLSQNNNVVKFLILKQTVPADIALESAILLVTNQ